MAKWHWQAVPGSASLAQLLAILNRRLPLLSQSVGDSPGGRQNLLESEVTISGPGNTISVPDGIDDHEYITIVGWCGTDDTPKLPINITVKTSELVVVALNSLGLNSGGFYWRQSMTHATGFLQLDALDFFLARNTAGTELRLRISESSIDTGKIHAVFGGDF